MKQLNSLTTQSRLSTLLSKKPLENIEEEEENAGNQHFLLFSQCFQPYQRQKIIIFATFIFLSANALNLDQSKIFLFGQESSRALALQGVLHFHIHNNQGLSGKGVFFSAPRVNICS